MKLSFTESMRRSASSTSARSGWGIVPASGTSFIRELPIVIGAIGLFYSVLIFARYWSGAVSSQPQISLRPSALPKYALFSVLRIALAYVCSLLFTLVYGYVAAYNRKAERIMVPLLDTLQSIPVLSFLPGVMLSMVTLFPNREIGVELGSILLIFTGQVWNMTFSFYSSLKTIPSEMREAATVYGLSWWQRFWQVELPYAAIGLIWNSMMSVAGGWFFLMACEMFVLGSRDFRLPGLGSYLQTAANAGDTGAIAWGLVTMVMVIIMIDQLIWRPVIAWAEKFKVEQVGAAEIPQSAFLDLLRTSRVIPLLRNSLILPLQERLNLRFARRERAPSATGRVAQARKWALRVIAALVAMGILLAVVDALRLLAGLSAEDLKALVLGALATFLRVLCVLLIGTAWTVPVGVWIGFNPRLARIAQPLAQIAASVPATALFP